MAKSMTVWKRKRGDLKRQRYAIEMGKKGLKAECPHRSEKGKFYIKTVGEAAVKCTECGQIIDFSELKDIANTAQAKKMVKGGYKWYRNSLQQTKLLLSKKDAKLRKLITRAIKDSHVLQRYAQVAFVANFKNERHQGGGKKKKGKKNLRTFVGGRSMREWKS